MLPKNQQPYCKLPLNRLNLKTATTAAVLGSYMELLRPWHHFLCLRSSHCGENLSVMKPEKQDRAYRAGLHPSKQGGLGLARWSFGKQPLNLCMPAAVKPGPSFKWTAECCATKWMRVPQKALPAKMPMGNTVVVTGGYQSPHQFHRLLRRCRVPQPGFHGWLRPPSSAKCSGARYTSETTTCLFPSVQEQDLQIQCCRHSWAWVASDSQRTNISFLQGLTKHAKVAKATTAAIDW